MSAARLRSRRLVVLLFVVLGAACRPAAAPATLAPVFPSEQWERVPSPEAAGFARAKLDAVVAQAKQLATTSLVAIAGGRLLVDYGDTTHLSYIASVRKSVLAMMYGPYVENGRIRLDKTLAALEISDIGGLSDQEREATIADLLGARSGVYHPASYGGDDLASAPPRNSQRHGAYYLYSNWDFNVLGTIFEQETGRNIYDALESDLARPIAMQDFKRDLQQKDGDLTVSQHPAYPMWFSTRDMARIGYLMLREGQWAGRPIVPRDWARRIVQVHTPARRDESGEVPHRAAGVRLSLVDLRRAAGDRALRWRVFGRRRWRPVHHRAAEAGPRGGPQDRLFRRQADRVAGRVPDTARWDRRGVLRSVVLMAVMPPSTRAAIVGFALVVSLAVATASCPAGGRPTQAAAARPVVFDGARVITGDGGPAIANATLVIDGGRIVAVGEPGRVTVPAAAVRVDVTGKTIMPAMIDAHAHIGYMRDLTSGPQNYTRENIVDHLQRYAYFGVAAGQAMGSDFTDLPYQVRDDSRAGRIPDAAASSPPDAAWRRPTRCGPTTCATPPTRITTEAEARAAVGELAGRGVTIVKTWVDDRGGAVRKLTPDLYGAIIDEAHRRGLRVMVHATALDDAKALLRAGVDGFGHAFQDVDDELLALIQARPQVFFLLALGGPRRVVSAPWLDPVHPLVQETVSPAQIARLQKRLAGQTPEDRDRARAAWERMAAGIARLSAVGARIGVGTDGGGQLGDQFVGWTVHTEVENMVAAGMTPAQVLTAATSTGAEILGLDDLGVIAPGKSADFVVLDASPLDDITNTRRIAQVYLRGTAVDRARLRAQWTGAGATR